MLGQIQKELNTNDDMPVLAFAAVSKCLHSSNLVRIQILHVCRQMLDPSLLTSIRGAFPVVRSHSFRNMAHHYGWVNSDPETLLRCYQTLPSRTRQHHSHKKSASSHISKTRIRGYPLSRQQRHTAEPRFECFCDN